MRVRRRNFSLLDGIVEVLDQIESKLHAALEPAGRIAGVVERVRTFAANAVQADDIAAMALRFVK